jgi:hypothetical protein
MNEMYHYVNPRTNQKAPLLSEEVHDVIQKNAEFLDSHIIYNRDFNYDYFGFKTLERSYLLKINGKIVERPQHMLMRVSVGIHLNDLEAVIETYDLMSKKFFTHATPTYVLPRKTHVHAPAKRMRVHIRVPITDCSCTNELNISIYDLLVSIKF